MTRYAVLTRGPSTDHGTFGTLVCHYHDRTEEFVSMELPDKGNRTGVSSIPAGRYTCVWDQSPSKGWCYHLQDVPGRSYILIHPGNWAGDLHKGFYSDLRGCIAVGMGLGWGTPPNASHGPQRMIVKSRIACEALRKFFDSQTFELEIV